MVWYSHLFQRLPQFILIHIVKGFGTVNKAEVDVFLELSSFFHDPVDVGNLISGSKTRNKSILPSIQLLSHVRLFATPWTVAYQAPPSMGFSRQEYWSGLPFSFSRGSSPPKDDPAIPLLGIHTEETRIERDTCTPMFIAALFIVARTWKQPRCPSADEWIRKLWYIYTMEYY